MAPVPTPESHAEREKKSARADRAANSGNYSIYNWLPSSWQNGGTKFALGNDVSGALFGDANEGTAGLAVGAGAAAAPIAAGAPLTAGARTSSFMSLNHG